MKARTGAHLDQEFESRVARALETADRYHPGESDPAGLSDLKTLMASQEIIAHELGMHATHLRRDTRTQRDLLRRLRTRRDYPHDEIRECRIKMDWLEARLDGCRLARIRILEHVNTLQKTLSLLEKLQKSGSVPID